MKNASFGVALGASACLILSGCSGSVGADPAETHTLHMTTLVAETDSTGQALRAMAEAIENEFPETVTTELYWSGAMAGPTELLGATGDGRATITNLSTAYTPNETPISSWADSLAQTAGITTTSSMFAATGAHSEFFTNQQIVEEYQTHGVTPVGAFVTPSYHLFCKDPIENADDANGRSVRAAAPSHVKELTALGMSPVSLEWAETYEALERGTVDCALTALLAGRDLALFDVAPNVALVPFSAPVMPLFVNSSALDSLPDDVVEFIQGPGLSAFMLEYFNATLGDFEELYAGGGELGEDSDVTLTAPTDLIDTLLKFRDDELKSLADQAPEGVDNPQQLIEEYLETMDFWTDQYETSTGISVDTFEYGDPESYRVLTVNDSGAAAETFSSIMDEEAFGQR